MNADDLRKVSTKLPLSAATLARNRHLVTESGVEKMFREVTAEAHNAPQIGHGKFIPMPVNEWDKGTLKVPKAVIKLMNKQEKEIKRIQQGNPKKKGSRYNHAVVTAFFKLCGLPTTEVEFAFAPPRKFRFDFAWRAHCVALEVEGGVWSGGAHGRGSGIVRDIEKYNLAASMGWFVLRCTPQDLCLVETAALVERTIKKSREKN